MKPFPTELNNANFRRAMLDLRLGAVRAPLWLLLGSQEIRQRYRRSRVGPFWITISMGVTVAALGLLYGGLFGRELHDYLPYLAAGFLVWGLVSSLILDGARAFISSEGLIQQLSAPLSLYVYRVAWSSLLIFLHNSVVFLGVALWFDRLPQWLWLLAIPGVWFGLLLGMVSARFRDVPQILASLVQVMFFITPILWSPDMLPGRALLLELNPFYYFVEMVRAPLLGELPSLNTWIAVTVITVLGWTAALVAYTLYRWRIAYWI
jgi:ABC-2 type transport system permease protein/lipopolysaccharide transport system permease protein